ARWIRRGDGWEFRDGSWAPDPSTAGLDTRIRRRITARPALSDLPPAIVESEPGLAGTDAEAGTNRLPRPPGTVTQRDPIAGAEASGEVPAIVIGPVSRMSYYVIRPPGAYPYGPNGVVVPGVVPPFVRRILDRVLP